MIRQLTIKNLAIIDDITIEFDQNLNVLTGETGAGKSIIIDAISLIFGAKANKELIADGKDFAFISVSLELKDNLANYIYENYQIDVVDECVISRTINSSGKSILKINGIIVPLYQLNEISPLLIDISSQNESQYLFDSKNHIKLLDAYIESKDKNFKKDYQDNYQKYLEIKNEYDDLSSKNIDEAQLEFINYKYQELKDYNYSLEDEQNIKDEYRKLLDIEKNSESFAEISQLLDDDISGSLPKLYQAIKQLGKLSSNEKLNEYYDKLNSLYLDLSDLSYSFKEEYGYSNFDYNRFEFLQNEITKINKLKRKYNVNDLLEYKNKLANELNMYSNREITLSKLASKLNVIKDKCLDSAKSLAKIRNKYALELSKLVKNELNDLYLVDASFSIRSTPSDELNSQGLESIEFYMSANKGVSEKPLAKVASGGEASRLMLGLKAVFTSLSLVDIIIFDEIDTGVSGKVALAMGKKMEKIAKNSQVLAITHLPQVAAMSDHHYYISKKNKDNKTYTFVKKLNDDEKVSEVARLLSGNEIGTNFIAAAKDLINSK